MNTMVPSERIIWNRAKFCVAASQLAFSHGRQRITLRPMQTLCWTRVTRRLSTVTSTRRPDLADDKVPPLNATPPRKPKIDLKPRPVKPATLRSDHSSPHTPFHSIPDGKKANRHYHPPRHIHLPKPFQTGLSLIELAKKDIVEAREKGVFDPPPKDAGSIKRFGHQLFQLLKFYFRGLKAINIHRKQVAAIRKRVQSGGALPTRAEARLIRTYRQDAFKLVPFIVIVLVAEELVPLVALYFPRMLPSTCILPGQRNRINLKARTDQLEALFRNREMYEMLCKQYQHTGFVPVQSLKDPVALCSSLGLPAWGPSWIASWRIRQHLKSISEDDDHLRKEGHGCDLTFTELQEALSERGIIPTPERSSIEDLRDQLRWWLDNSAVMPVGADLVSRRLLLLGMIGSQKF
ncbi:hypothetical protein V8B97DRAFT_716769 [Scleroderma yunnanense]